MKYLPILLMLFSVNGLAIGSFCEDYSSLSTTTEDGKKIKMVIPGSKVKAAGAWSPEDGEPILPITQAYAIAKEWAGKNLTRYDGVSIEDISLKKYGCSQGGYWYYFIEYTPYIEGNKLWGTGNWLTVLMSGEVLPPVKE